MSAVRLVVLSDTHDQHDRVRVPDGDVVVHAGDLTSRGTLAQVERFASFFARLPHAHKVLVAGNHDFCFQHQPDEARGLVSAFTYLQDEQATIEGLTFHGSPWQPWFHDWAFNLPRGQALAQKWALVPATVDVLVTHGPPLGHGDRVLSGERVGCEDLLERDRQVRPSLHCFGHIHEDAGITHEGPTTFVNASICTVRYVARQPARVLDWDGGRWTVVEP